MFSRTPSSVVCSEADKAIHKFEEPSILQFLIGCVNANFSISMKIYNRTLVSFGHLALN